MSRLGDAPLPRKEKARETHGKARGAKCLSSLALLIFICAVIPARPEQQPQRSAGRAQSREPLKAPTGGTRLGTPPLSGDGKLHRRLRRQVTCACARSSPGLRKPNFAGVERRPRSLRSRRSFTRHAKAKLAHPAGMKASVPASVYAFAFLRIAFHERVAMRVFRQTNNF